jgi:biotin transport system substrate-specific component
MDRGGKLSTATVSTRVDGALQRLKMNAADQLRTMVFASLLAALMAAGAFIAIPIGPVPLVLQNMFVLLAGLLLGSRWGLASVGVYLLAGACGLPVFAGGAGGIGRIVGPTGGYLLGYLAAVFIVGYITERWGQRSVVDVIAMICGTVVVYAGGIGWLKILTGMSWSKTLMTGLFPFLLGDALKIVAAAVIAKAVRPIMRVAGHASSA